MSKLLSVLLAAGVFAATSTVSLATQHEVIASAVTTKEVKVEKKTKKRLKAEKHASDVPQKAQCKGHQHKEEVDASDVVQAE